ncbi:MAG TPA: hypothetical protein VEK06_02830, partial [Myxococcota bacterium]|nr:hypothetical protein [Myxococcota bacterium]
CLVSCSTSKAARAELALESPAAKKLAQSYKRILHSLEMRQDDSKLKDEKTTLKAELYEPNNVIEPKTLVILVPGTGKVSRRGETISDGVKKYPSAIELYALWAAALLDQGFYVLTYDKRTCTEKINPLCTNKASVEEQSLEVLARDLDDVYDYAIKKAEFGRVIRMGHTQAAQVVALSKLAAKEEDQKRAEGLVLLSPISGSLEKMLVDGYTKANLKNEAENKKSFFGKLQKGEFGEHASFYGTSVKFWKSWIDASLKTIPNLLKRNQKTLMLFSEKDVFSSESNARQELKNNENRHNFAIQSLSNVDKNFLNNQSLGTKAVSEVVRFIKGLKPAPPATAQKTTP